jgi:hypothetical protein
VAASVDKLQQLRNVDLGQAVEERIVHRVFAAGILQGPERLAVLLFQLDLRVFADRMRRFTVS